MVSSSTIRIIIAFLAVITIVEAIGKFDFRRFLNRTDPNNEEFSKLVERFKLQMNSSQDVDQRMENFRKAKGRIAEFSRRHKKAKFGVNKFSLMTDDEQKKFLGVDPLTIEATTTRGERSAIEDTIDLTAPESLDYRTLGKVSPVKNQRKCGSCWAHTVVGAIESQYLLRYNQTLDLSEQDIISCNDANKGCAGGDVTRALKYIKANGITTEYCLPYNASTGTCTTSCNDQKYFVNGYHTYGKDESTYAAKLNNYGPATMVLYVPREFMSYQSGILDIPGDVCLQNYIGGHGVVIVGYTPEYWIAKNSWGDDWGEQGFFRFKRGQNFCGMTKQVTSPYLNMSTPLPVTPPTTTTTPAPTTPSKPFNGCPGGAEFKTLTDEDRFTIMNWFNDARSNVAKGQYVMENGQVAPSGQNINKLTYNCSLEGYAQQYADTCNSSLVLSSQYRSTLTFTYNATISQTFTKAFPRFFSFNNATINDTAVSEKARFAWSDATSIACGYSRSGCNSAATKVTLTCFVTPVQPTSKPIYSRGSPCTSDAECTKPGVSRCDKDLGLCYA